MLLSRACGLLFLAYTQKPTLHLVSMTASPLIPILPPWILLFSLIFKLLFLKVWSLVLFSTTLLDKSSIIPRVTVSNSQASLPTTPHFLFSLWFQSQVTASLSLELLKLEILVVFVPFSSSFPHIQSMHRFCSSCLLNTC